ncbi:putative protein arginine N-methyltransferase 3 [Dorcoceras hygrometricum]|uniref:Secreted protein n=1 Tax=Dorcoceras hygrometricum TaxID=472368 RepID=A0A2Z7BSM6_9LAMI|nr:putative protein arginine N-methyltransferase 3 [Dorcoceras hygrometricum]
MRMWKPWKVVVISQLLTPLRGGHGALRLLISYFRSHEQEPWESGLTVDLCQHLFSILHSLVYYTAWSR